MIFAILLFAASLWALLAKASSPFIWYLSLQVLSLPTLYSCLWIYGKDSKTYFWTYILLTGLILLSAVFTMLGAMADRAYRLRAAAIAFVLAISIGRMAFFGLEHPARPEDWLVLIEAVVLLWAGIMMAYVAKYQRNGWEYFTLGVLWLGYALWDFGLILHYPAWLIADWYVPSAWLTLGFIVMGFLLRVSRVERRHARRGGYVENKG